MSDTARVTTVAVSAVVAVVGAVIGSGFLVGTPIPEAAGGALAADATLLAPGGGAFSIWSVIYVGLVALALYQLLDTQRRDPRQRRAGWWVAASLLLNAAWILTVQAGSVLGSFVLITALLGVLVITTTILRRSSPGSPLQAVLLDGVMGFYLGWVLIATVANGAATLTSTVGWSSVGAVATLWALALLLLAGAAGVALAWFSAGRIAPALSLGWGLAWIVVARSTGAPESLLVAVVAALMAVVVLAAPVLVRVRARSRGQLVS